MITTPLAVGIDYAWAQVPAPAAKAAGVQFVVRYLGGSAALTPAERDNLHAAGIAIVLVWETAADEADHPERGAGDAVTANDQADALGYPGSCPIFYADDHNDAATADEAAYMRNVLSVGRRPADLYSGRNVLGALGALLAFGGWAVETWYPTYAADPCMVQLANTRDPIHIAGIPDDQFDTDLLLKPIPAWGPDGVVILGATPPPDESEPVMLFRTVDGDTVRWWRDAGGWLVEISAPQAYALASIGAKVCELGGLLSAFAYNVETDTAFKSLRAHGVQV